MTLDDARKHRVRTMSASLVAGSGSPEELAAWQESARLAADSLRQDFGDLGLDDGQLAWIAFGTAKIYAVLSAMAVGYVSGTIDRSMTAYGMAAGILAGVHELPGEPEAVNADGAEAPSAPVDLPTGQYL